MRKIFLLFFLGFITINANSQNLVPNPSFEDTVSCPMFLGDIDHAQGWSSYRESPDYFNICAVSAISTPSNGLGFQTPQQGNAYAGIVCYTTVTPNVREFLGTTLLQPVLAGQKYYFKFYVSLADNLSFDCGINHMGIRLSNLQYSSSNPAPINNNADYFSNSIITDKLNWTEIKGDFIALQNYQHLQIGNFFDDLNIDTVDCLAESYYFIDNICLSPDSIYCNLQSSLYDVIDNKSVLVYPKVTDDELFCKSSIDLLSLEIFDLNNKLCYKNILPERSIIIDVRNFMDGLYILRINTREKFLFYKFYILN